MLVNCCTADLAELPVGTVRSAASTTRLARIG
jgi:hypothetical protein